MSNFSIKSIIHDYAVEFIDNTPEILKKEIKNGDVIIIDNKIIELYPSITDTISDCNLLIGIEAKEKQKSYKGK